jgi:hypothetical protein
MRNCSSLLKKRATRYDKLGANFLAFLQLAAVRISLRLIESTPWSRKHSACSLPVRQRAERCLEAVDVGIL